MNTVINSNIRQVLSKNGLKIQSQVAELELTYKRKYDIPDSMKDSKICQSLDAADIFRRSFKDGQIEHKEYFKAMYLSRSNKVLSVVEISSGGISGTVADPKIVFQGALLNNASSIILCHNHPSGNLKPSRGDNDLTQKMKNAGQFLEMPVLDHVILSNDSYYSFADEGRL